jgi:DNA repair exonuclease SbcCD nuclease subunit
MKFRFIHTGDIHLDSPLQGLSGQTGAAAERIRTATRAAFANLVEYAIDETADFFIIAGDLYDGDWRDYQTGLFFVGQMGRLAQANIPVFLIFGNHDAESQITKRLTLPENVRVFSSRKPQTFELKGLRVALHGQSFRQRDISENLVPAYPAPVHGSFNIGILHTGLGGMGGHANYAPCSLDDLVNKGYDYWALAHVHQSAVLHQQPYIVFCGNLQGRHIRETGPKSAYFVTVEDGQVSELLPVESDVVRWTRIPVTVDNSDNATDVVGKIGRAIEHAAADASGGRLLACRIELTGRTKLHDYLLCSRDQLGAEARAAALALGEEAAWVERLVIGTEPPTRTSTAARQDATDGAAEIISEASNDAELRAQLEAHIGELVRKLPYEIRSDPEDGILKAAIDGDYSKIAGEASQYLAALLSAEDA